MKLPPGTRIRFTVALDDTGSDLGRRYANPGDLGIILSHDCKEGYYVETDDNRGKPFGAERKDFEPE